VVTPGSLGTCAYAKGLWELKSTGRDGVRGERKESQSGWHCADLAVLRGGGTHGLD
jgi:hypothetical protein